jgi:hypothetical protein
MTTLAAGANLPAVVGEDVTSAGIPGTGGIRRNPRGRPQRENHASVLRQALASVSPPLQI